MIKIARCLLLSAIIGISYLQVAYAQPGDPGGGGDPDVPIQGIGFLIALGVALGIRKIVKDRKQK